MTGPYKAEIRLGRSIYTRPADLVLGFEEMYYADGTGEKRVDRGAGFPSAPISSAAEKVWRYYQGGPSSTLVGFSRLAAFYVGELLEPGEEADVEVVGREPSTKRERAHADGFGVRRDAAGRLFASVGSRWNRERHFVGA